MKQPFARTNQDFRHICTIIYRPRKTTVQPNRTTCSIYTSSENSYTGLAQTAKSRIGKKTISHTHLYVYMDHIVLLFEQATAFANFSCCTAQLRSACYTSLLIKSGTKYALCELPIWKCRHFGTSSTVACSNARLSYLTKYIESSGLYSCPSGTRQQPS